MPISWEERLRRSFLVAGGTSPIGKIDHEQKVVEVRPDVDQETIERIEYLTGQFVAGYTVKKLERM